LIDLSANVLCVFDGDAMALRFKVNPALSRRSG
jgi:hypothetical protein